MACCGGLALGALTVAGQGVLPGSWNHFANSGAVWLLGAFLIGASMPSLRWACPAGVVTLLAALAGYAITSTALGFPYTWSAAAFWGVIGVAGGPVFGGAGYAWRSPVMRRRVVGVALLGSVFIAEGWYTLHYNQDLLAGWASMRIGLLLAMALARTGKERLYTLLVMLPITGVGMGVFAVISGLTY